MVIDGSRIVRELLGYVLYLALGSSPCYGRIQGIEGRT